MNILDKDYKKKERKLIKYYDTILLSKLLFLNIKFSNYEYNGTTGQDVFEILQKKINYTEKEKREIINNAILFMKIKYDIQLIDFSKLEFR